MLTLNINYDVLQDRLITIKLPEEVNPGQHELVIILDQKTGRQTNAKKLMQFAGTIATFQKIDGLAYQREIRSEWK